MTPEPSPGASDAALLRRYRQGDAAAFSELYARHRQGLFRFLLGLCGEQALAEEVFQETWLSLIRTDSDIRQQVQFKTWLYQIARNRLIDHWRRQGRKTALHDSYDEAEHGRADPTAGPEQQLSFSRDQQRLAAALADLPAEQREVFLLRAQGDLELHEIAELTATAQETVKSRLRYALQKLRRLLGEPATIEEKSA